MKLPGKGMSWKEFLVGLKDEVSNDNLTDVAATVTYYGVLALFPFLLFMVALASVLITPQQAEALVRELSQVAPGAVTQIVGDRIRQLGSQQNVTLLGFGALGAIWAASGAMTAVMRALNITYDVQEGRPFWKVRGVAVAMTLVTGALSLVAALAAVVAAPIAEAVGGPIGTAITWLRLPFAGVVMMFLWALLYYYLPDAEQDFKFITPGSVGGVIAWVIASWGFSKYVVNFGSYDKTYGSIAGVIVLLLWMWISALVLLVGAEVNALIEHRSADGKRQGAKSMRDRGEEPLAVVPPRGVPVPAGADGAPRTREKGARERRPPLRGVAAMAAGFAAGLLVARRQA
jgi:membrane protein